MMVRSRDERGSISVWLVTSSFVMMMLVGLAVDLGGQVHAKQRAHNIAAQAARTGGEQVQAAPAIEGDYVAVDAVAARHAAEDYLAASGVTGNVTISDGDTITVNVTDTYTPKFLSFIGLGDLATGSIKRVFDQVGVKPGEIPVVGWGNSLDTTQEVLDGYVNAAQWQDPQATSYIALSLAAMEAGGVPAGFDVITGALYEKDTAQVYDDILSGK